MIAGTKWLNVETVKHRSNKSGTANATKSQLGIAKHAGVNIVLSRGSGRQSCWLVSDWNEAYSKIITNAYARVNGSLTNHRHSELERPSGRYSDPENAKIPERCWKLSTKN